MIDDSLRSRLEALNRSPIPAQTEAAQRDGEAASSGLNLRKIAAAVLTKRLRTTLSQRPATATTKFTPGLLRSGDIIETRHGPHLRIRLPLENLWPNGTQLISARQEFL